MQSHAFTPDALVAIIATGLVLVCCLPSLRFCVQRCFSRPGSRGSVGQLYQDKDGSATEESQKAHSDLFQRIVILASAILGTVVSILSVAATWLDRKFRCSEHKRHCSFHGDSVMLDQCVTLIAWVLVLGQATVIFGTRSTVHKARLGIFLGLSTLILFASLLVQAIGWHFFKLDPSAAKENYALVSAQTALGLLVALASFLVPRRPDVYRDGQIVDRQYTVSFLERITFSWATALLRSAANTQDFDIKHLPLISDETRSRSLQESFDKVFNNNNLWWALFWSNKSSFIVQWTVQIFQAFSIFVPAIALYYSLRLLEARDAGEDNTLQLWLVILVPGISDAITMSLETFLWYVCYNRIQVPMYEQLAAVIFAKSLRKKDVKGVSDKAASEPGQKSSKDDLTTDRKGGAEDDIQEDGVAKTRQSTINLMGVDGQRIASFATFNCMLLGAGLKIVIAVFGLVKLIGWVPLLSGFGTFFALIPINWWVTNNYYEAQDRVMKLRDAKMAVVTEALQGIRQIKFSALESEWYNKIGKVRRREMGAQWRAFVFDICMIAVWIFGPICLSVISLTVYALINKQLTASVAFTTITIFDFLEITLAVVPELFADYFDAVISTQRIREYLNSSDQEHYITPGENITFNGATVGWPADESRQDDNPFKLHDLNLSFPEGALSVVSGKTGSGKSLLLSAIIGEAELLSGSVTVPKAPLLAQRFDDRANKGNWIIKEAIAYVAQIPWIENATIRENVLFGLPYDPERYRNVIESSALTKDLEMLQDGDMTDIGANGINLSGGQKWRVSFARALYSRAGILILDDIFSAVDSHVGKHLFDKALTGEIGEGRTRILVTHHVALCLPKTTYSVLLENGAVLEAGQTDELRRNGRLRKILAQDVDEQKHEDEDTGKNEDVLVVDGEPLQLIQTRQSIRSRRISVLSDAGLDLVRTQSYVADERSTPNVPKKFVQEEDRATGATKVEIYASYLQAGGGYRVWIAIVFVFSIWTAVFISRSYWISIWTRAYQTESTGRTNISLFQQSVNGMVRLRKQFAQVEVDHSLSYYLGVYIALAVASWIIGCLKYFSIYSSSIRASKVLFEKFCYRVLRAPLRFLDTTPVGRILNRFTADFNLIDSKLAPDLAFSLHSLVASIAVVIAGAFVSPLIVVAAAFLFVVCLWYARRYLAGAREVKRLESNAKSPVFEQFSSVLTGLGTVRAFGKSEAYLGRMQTKLDTHCQAYFHLWLFTRWMSWRVGMVGSVFLLVMGILVVSIPNIDAPLAGFAVSFSMQLSESVVWMLRQYSNVELDMNAIERVVEYSEMPIEDQDGDAAPAAWPTKGEVEIDDLVVAYAPDLSPVLKGLTFSVKPNERVGVVGRTGAGKSSLTLALFRFLEARSGSIHIDGIDISKIKLFDLRSRLAIIPQDPVLFSGTVRSNLDEFDRNSDSELRDALARVHLIPSASAVQSGTATPLPSDSEEGDTDAPMSNTNVFKSLNSKISEGGLNLSQGQRQLLCLARAIVARPKIMVLDEATSSVDMKTDALIQRSIREEFADSTLIVIAHRLSTIADFDRILVLGDGKVLEYDTPKNLMNKTGGVFRAMVEDSGERKELEQIINGQVISV